MKGLIVQTGFGTFDVNGLFQIAICKNCLASILMTPEEGTHIDNILKHLDNKIKCCGHSEYHFSQVLNFEGKEVN